MSDDRAIHLVSDTDRTRWLTLRAARGARIDKLSVDRSRYQGLPRHIWCPEAQAAEPKLQAIREETTLADRMAAWRELFASNRRL